ncbi:hypothetical protein Pfo_017727 [Paulownia fortunei]|nr:hypothetical protein Pfo_017727 [Paulownia fortunei]
MSTVQEALWLVYAVHRHGINNWDAVAAQLNTTCVGYRRDPPPYTARGCRQRYLTMRKRFKNSIRDMDTLSLIPVGDDDQEDNNKAKDQKMEQEDAEYSDEEKEKALLEIMMKEFNQLRQAELRLEIYGENTQVKSEPVCLKIESHSVQSVINEEGDEAILAVEGNSKTLSHSKDS